MMFRSLFPVPLPGESLYSLLACFVDSWFGGSRTGVKALLGSRYPSSPDLGAGADIIHQNISPAANLSVEQLVLNHTALPLHLPFVSEERARSLLRMATTGRSVHAALGVPAEAIKLPPRLRVCPECRIEDAVRYNRPYYHVIHQQPGVLVCPRHGVALWSTDVRPCVVPSAPQYVSAGRARLVRELEIPQGKRMLAKRVAREMDSLMTSPPGVAVGAARMGMLYRDHLRAAGFSMPNGSVALSRVTTAMAIFYGELASFGCPVRRTSNWIASLVRPPRSHQHPTKHVLLLTFLGIPLKAALPEAQEIRAVTVEAVQATLPAPVRLSKTIKVRRAWLQAPKGIKRPASYWWLWKHDRAWLRKHLAGRHVRQPNVVRWRTLDTRLSKAIPELLQRIMRRRPARRASRSAIAQLSGHPSWLIRDHSGLPLTNACIRRVAETPAAFAIRRIKMTAAGYPEMVPLWKLRVAAGVSATTALKPAVARALLQLSLGRV